MRSALLALLLLPTLAAGQDKKDDQDGKVSNDDPARPLQMPPASTEVKEAIEDFERFQRRGAWERALKALYTIPADQAARFVDGEDGFIIPVERKRRAVLAALPPDGQAACRLFYDAEARKLLDEAEGPTELKDLERVYSAYFITTVGDNAADRLGDLYFELGRFDQAADCWLAVLRERPDTDLSPALLSLKAALALSRAGRRAEFEQVRDDLAGRFADEEVTIGGRTARPGELLRDLIGSEGEASGSATTASDPPEGAPPIAGTVDAAWRVRFAESVEAGMTPAELTQWEGNALSAAVPAATVEGSRLFVDYLGYVFAVDLASGKMLWRSASFHQLEIPAMQNQFLDPARLAILASGERVWCLDRDLKDPNFAAPFHLTCRRADDGEVAWRSSDLPDYAGIDLVGRPILADGKLFVAARGQGDPQHSQGLPQQLVLAVQPLDGKVLWKSEVGSFRQGTPQYFFYNGYRPQDPQPRLVYRAGAVYVDTHVGVLARLDADTGRLDWGFGYRTDPAQGQNRFFFGFDPAQQQESPAASSLPVELGEALLVKGVQSDRLYAVDPSRMKVLWERPIARSSRLLGADDRLAFLGGAELGALDLRTRDLLWSTRVPNGSAEGRVLVRRDGLWQLTPRGVFEIDPRSGAVRRIFRGEDLGSAGGDLLLTDRWLIAVSNRSISAYPRPQAGGEDRADAGTGKGGASND